jgi:P4 family phage/plasmid primase-like protien
MATKENLRAFLDAHKSEGVYTHTSVAGGSYFISEDDLPKFHELYVEAINDEEKLYLVEKSTDISSLRVDFDFAYADLKLKKHLHTREQVCAFAKAYITEISQYLQVPEKVELFIMEKYRPTKSPKGDKMKSGIHIVVPSICTHTFVEQRVRRNLLKTAEDIFKDLPLIEKDWKKIYDEGVAKRSGSWQVYGSRKNDPDSKPYMISYIINYSGGETSVVTDIPDINVSLIKKLSVSREDSDETPMTEEGKAIYGELKTSGDPRISGGRAVTPSRGRRAIRGDARDSRGSSPDGRIVIPPLDPDRKNYIQGHVMNLKKDRADVYDSWLKVAICLYNIHPDLLDVFLDFSAQNEDKYNEADCIQKWNSITYRNDGEKIQEGTLRYWSREDNREGYDLIESSNVDRLVLAATSGTEHDVACVIFAKFRDLYKCSDFGKNVWFRWAGHIWRETDKGVDLQLKLSKQIASVFFDKVKTVQDEMSDRGLTSCSGEDKKDCGTCEYCQIEKQRTGLNAIYTKLKTTKFKDNVMKECRELFFDEEFTKKVDSNKDIIAFNNGVLDLTTFEFRDGKPEDYLSFSTGVDYDPEKEYYSFPEWPKVEAFIAQVLPDREVREYFLKHLATNLVGGNTAQKFHILTGSGSNGKSMIMNLTSTALGDYACTVPISLFTQKRKGSGSAAPEVIRLKGRRFVTMQEPDESIALNTGLMKEITSGEKMYARDLFKSGTEFEVQAKFHLACNDKPKINTTDGGTWRRLVVINFVSKFVPVPSAQNEYPMDESIQFAVNSKEWATPFLAYLVHLLKEGNGYRKLPTPDKVLEYTSEYRNENDGINKFVSEKLSATAEGDEVMPVDKPTLRRAFKTWKDENDQKTLSPSDMEKRVEAVYGKYTRGGWLTFKLD